MTKVIMRNAPASVHYLKGPPPLDHIRPYIPPPRRRRPPTRIKRIASAILNVTAWALAISGTAMLGAIVGVTIGWAIK